MSAARKAQKDASESGNAAKKQVLVVGAGYLGSRVAKLAMDLGSQVWVSTRSPSKAEKLAKCGYHPILIDWMDSRTLRSIPDVQSVLVAVSYDRHSRYDRYESHVVGLSNLLTRLGSRPRVCYISTTGVYHQTDGSWVDETTPTHPRRDGGKAHLMAENVIHRIRASSPTTILRLAGIYGPGRIPRIGDIESGRPIEVPESSYLNLIHVDDAAQAVMSSWSRMGKGIFERMYVVSDDRPVLRRSFYAEVARLSGSPPPTFGKPSSSSPERMRLAGNKRVWNRRFKRDLMPCLRFPDYKIGLSSLLAHRKQM